MAYSQPTSGEIEFNSMAAILRRLDNITNNINLARDYKDPFAMYDYIVAYFKEIVGDLTNEEIKIWDELKTFKTKINLYKQRFLAAKNNGKIMGSEEYISELDEFDIKIRRMAKGHGYLTKQGRYKGAAILEM